MFTPEMRMRTHTIFCFKVNSTQVIWKNCDSILKWIFQPTSSTFLKKIHENCQEYKGSVSTNCIYLSGGFPEVHKHFCESQWLWWWLAICNVWFLFALKKNHNLQFLCHKLSGFYCSSCRVFLWSYSFDLPC